MTRYTVRRNNSTASKAASPPPTTTTVSLVPYAPPSHTAQEWTCLPQRSASPSSPNRRGSDPVARTTARVDTLRLGFPNSLPHTPGPNCCSPDTFSPGCAKAIIFEVCLPPPAYISNCFREFCSHCNPVVPDTPGRLSKIRARASWESARLPASKTDQPDRARYNAAVIPAGPEPTTRTS